MKSKRAQAVKKSKRNVPGTLLAREMGKNFFVTTFNKSFIDGFKSGAPSLSVTGSQKRAKKLLRDAEELFCPEIDSILRNLPIKIGDDRLARPPLSLTTGLRDGRYSGSNNEIAVELRIDQNVCRVISADLFYRATDNLLPRPTWIAAFRTLPATSIDFVVGEWHIIAEDRNATKSAGMLQLVSVEPNGRSLSGRLTFTDGLEGLPANSEITFSLEWKGISLRSLGLEVETEIDVPPPPLSNNVNDQTPTIASVLANSGVEIFASGNTDHIPPGPKEGWSEKALETLMHDFAQTTLDQPNFSLQLLWLSKSNRNGLFGVMFDTGQDLPRQGLAIFANEISSVFQGEQLGKKLIQTTVHEMGHALNLVHRFERGVDRADSTSFMNYDWRYRGGNHSAEFWERFNFTFDDDELAFIRHAPWEAIIPGGKQYHSVRYWAEGNGGYMPYIPQSPLSGFKLTLELPQAGPVFAFNQPVILGVRLKNETNQSISIPSFILDSKTGFLEILIRRMDGPDRRRSAPSVFVPLTARCYDSSLQLTEILQPGAEKTDNVNITFGTAGFAFSEPGMYEVKPLLAVYDDTQHRDLIIPGNPVVLRISYPKTAEDEHDAMTLLRSDVGRFFAFGGSDRLKKTADDLAEIMAKRTYRAQKRQEHLSVGSSTIRDPVIANIIRCKGLNSARNYCRYVDGKFIDRVANIDEAVSNLNALDDFALKTFDTITASATSILLAKLERTV